MRLPVDCVPVIAKSSAAEESPNLATAGKGIESLGHSRKVGVCRSAGHHHGNTGGLKNLLSRRSGFDGCPSVGVNAILTTHRQPDAEGDQRTTHHHQLVVTTSPLHRHDAAFFLDDDSCAEASYKREMNVVS
jgi:hypothetical protein